MAAGPSFSQSRWRDSPYLPAILILSIFLLMRQQGLARLPHMPTFVQVDTLMDKNWTQVAAPKLSLTRVHSGGLLHHRVWVLPFDEMWQVGLSELSPRDTCAGALGAVEAHVVAGASVSSAASEIAGRVRRSRRVAPLLPLGRPFLLENGVDREIVHVFGMLVQGVFLRRDRQWFARVERPVEFVRKLTKAAEGAGGDETNEFCSKERAEHLARAVAYALRRFKIKGFIPKSNPMDGARFDERICCEGDVDATENLRQCAVACNRDGVYNMVSMFPEAA